MARGETFGLLVTEDVVVGSAIRTEYCAVVECIMRTDNGERRHTECYYGDAEEAEGGEKSRMHGRVL